MPTYTVRPGVFARALDQETVILDSESGTYFRLNSTGAVIWDRLASAAPVAEVVSHLARTCEVPPEEVQADVAELIDVLVDRGLLQVGS